MATPNDLGALTRHREVSIRWDIAQDVLVEPATLIRRMGKTDIFPAQQANVEKLESGVFVLQPENDISILHEDTDAQQYIIRRSAWNAGPQWVEVPRSRALSELTDVGFSTDVPASGDWFITRRVPAGEAWSASALSVGDGPVYNSPYYPLDAQANAPITGLYEANQGYLIRLIIPGGFLQTGDGLFAFRFGGVLSAEGYGEFQLIVGGGGGCTLHENVGGEWFLVDNWQISDYKDMSNGVLTIRIIPHFPRFIEFRSFAGVAIPSDLVKLSDATMEANLVDAARHVTYSVHTHTVRRPGDIATSGDRLRTITGPGGIIVFVRRDLLMSWQVSRIAYKDEGFLIDRPFVIPCGVGNEKIIRLRLVGFEPVESFDDPTPLADMDGEINQADGTGLNPGSESFILNAVSYSYTGWELPGGQNKCAATITLRNNQAAGARWQTPCLEGYEVHRQATIDTLAPGEKTGGEIRSVRITGPGYHPDHESASVVIEDTKAELGIVFARRTPVIIETTFDAADQTKKAVLFRGFTGRVDAALKGFQDRIFPVESHHRLDADLIGMWERLATNRFTYQQLNLADASSHPLGRGQNIPGPVRLAWKVTDAIWYLLYSCGFTPAQLDIPNSDIRFFVTPGESAEDTLVIQPGTDIGPLTVEFARRFLNQYLVWDGGAGADGMWRLLTAPTSSSTPIWNFTLEKAPAGRLGHLSASYGAAHSPILDVDGAEYKKRDLSPEGNVLTVIGRVGNVVGERPGREILWNQYINWSSWNAPGHDDLADPNGPDWLGEIRPIEIVDGTLTTQEAVDFVTRRVGEAACRGRRLHQFAAELVLVDVDATDAQYTVRTHRPLRVGDCVNFKNMDGAATKCVVHSAEYYFEKSTTQLAFYEIEELRSGLSIGNWR